MDTKNELYALHLDGELILNKTKTLRKELKEKRYFSPWQVTKCYYSTEARAKLGRGHFPEEIRDRITIVKYIPEGTK